MVRSNGLTLVPRKQVAVNSGWLAASLIVLATLGIAAPEVCAQDEPETRDMPETLPELAQDDTTPTRRATETQENASTEAEPRVGLRLEAQILVALAFPFGGNEQGSAFGYGLTYGAGWGEIPIMIGLDFMSVGRSNSTTSRVTVGDDV